MLMALKRNEKGLTLIELLAVLVIVAIIAAIAIPAISGTIAKSKEKADIATENMIKEAAMRYVIDEELKETTTGIVIKTALVDKGYLNGDVTWNGTAKTTFSATKGSNNGWTIDLQ